MKKHRALLMLVCFTFGICVLGRSNRILAMSPARKATAYKRAAVNIGWGDGKNVVVPLQIAYAVLDEVDVEANQAINVQVGKLNGIDTLVLTVPLNQIACPQKVRVVNLRTGSAVRFHLKLTGKNIYGYAPVQSSRKVEMKPRRLRLNVGRPEERKGGGRIEVCYVPSPTGSYWVMTREFTVISAKREKK